MIVKTISKGLEYGQKAYQYHLDKECHNIEACPQNESWERRISIAQDLLSEIVKEKKPSDRQEQQRKYNISTHNPLPIIELNDSEELWLNEIYKRIKQGERFTFKDVWSSLYKRLPLNFQPNKIDGRLVSNNGEEIRLLGVIALEKNYSIIEKIDNVIISLRNLILEDPSKRTFETSEISERCRLSPSDITIALHLSREYGTFFSGHGSDSGTTIFKTVDVGGSDAIFYQYVNFQGIEKLFIQKSSQKFTQPLEEFTEDEIEMLNAKLDGVLEDLSKLKAGQEVIYTDVLKEIEELKYLYSLGKKNWRQLFKGKFIEMAASGLVSETVSKRIADIINPVINNLIG
jgi:hypothetical protein